jgi:hypothetical protein
MRRTLIGVAILSSWATASVVGQQTLPPLRVGTHVAGNMMNGPFDMYRVGAQLVVPVGPRFAFYPSVSRFLDGAEWEMSAALRYRPFGSPEGSSPLYLGMGLAGINWGSRGTGYDLLITGLELPTGRLRPYVELQFLGPVLKLVNPSHDWGVQAHTGLTWAVR